MLLVVLLGCGGSEEPWARIPVEGDVALPNAPAAEIEGSITFAPDGIEGPGTTTTIKAGKFYFDSTNGPVAGKHHVMLQLIRPASWEKPKITGPLNHKTDPNVKERMQCDFLPQQRLSATVPGEKPYTVRLTAAPPEPMP